VPLFLYCDVIFSKVAVGLRDRLRLAFNSCAWYVFGTRRSELISGYSARILGLPLGKYYSFRICCQMYRIKFTQKLDYLYWELHFGCSARLSNLIVRWHQYAATPSSFFFGVRFSRIVCLRQSGASLVREGSEVDAMRLLGKLLSLTFCNDPLQIIYILHFLYLL
jgi:hypothetical protein